MIVINARFLTHQITGVERYAIEMSRELKKIRDDLVFIAPRKGIILDDIAEEFEVIKIGRLSGHLWEQIELPLFLKRKKNPLLVNFINTAPVFYKYQITVIHDLAFVDFPETFNILFRYYYQFMIPRVIKKSKKIITVSQISKNNILNHYIKDFEDIHVIYNAVADSFKSKEINKKNNDVNDKVLLSVGSLHPQKNIIKLIEAMQYIARDDVILKIIGQSRSNFNQKVKIDKSILNDRRIQFIGRVDDQTLVNLYQNATLFISPSLYEGFGIPPLEAQTCGTPILISDIDIYHEIYGDSAEYFDQNNSHDIAEKILAVIDNKRKLEAMKKAGLKNQEKYSWKKSAEKLNDMINEIN